MGMVGGGEGRVVVLLRGGGGLVAGVERGVCKGGKGGYGQDLQKHISVLAGDGIGMERWGGEEECDERCWGGGEGGEAGQAGEGLRVVGGGEGGRG